MRLRWLVLLPLLLSPGAALADGPGELARGSIAYRDGEYEAAVAAFTAALAAGDLGVRDQVTAYSLRGVARVNLDDPQAAIGDYTAALRIEPDNALLFTRRGVAQASTGRYAEAIGDYRRALELKPDNAIARDNMADAVRLMRGGAPAAAATAPAPPPAPAKPPSARTPPGAGAVVEAAPPPSIEDDPAASEESAVDLPPAPAEAAAEPEPLSDVVEPATTDPAPPPAPTGPAEPADSRPEPEVETATPAPPDAAADPPTVPPEPAPAPTVAPTAPEPPSDAPPNAPSPPAPQPQVAAAEAGDPAAAGRYEATSWVNMRAGPGSSFEALDVIQIGQEVRVRQNVRGWLEVELGDGRRGYVYESYLRALD